MTNFNFEGQPEGDSDDLSNISWTELDWLNFLLRQDKEIARFLRFYDNCPVPDLERLDWVAQNMGWDSEDWSVADFPDDGEFGELIDETEEGTDDIDPYTLHRHPVYVVSTGLLYQLRYRWRQFLMQQDDQTPVNALALWDFGDAIADTERHCLLSLQCMDMGDFLLCVVHFKRAIAAINQSMHRMAKLLAADNNTAAAIQGDLRMRLFDLREVCLRVIRDCRDEGFEET